MYRRLYRLQLLSLLMAVTLISVAGSNCTSAASAQARQILILHSYHFDYPWTEELHKGVMEVLGQAEEEFVVSVEYLDTKRHFDGMDGAYLRSLAALIENKYAGTRFDSIITTDDTAFYFALANHKRALKQAPIVFVGVNDFDPARVPTDSPVTGIVEQIDLVDTLLLAQLLLPETRRVVVVTDPSQTGKVNRRVLEELRHSWGGKLTIDFIDETGDGLTMTDVKRRLSALTPGTVVYVSDFALSADGFVNQRKMMQELSAATPVPILSHNGIDLGNGIVGGKLNHGHHLGEEAGRLTLNILQGTSADDLPIRTDSINQYMFDHHMLQRFGIPDSRLPRGHILINQPASWISTYGQLVGILALLGLGSLVWIILLGRQVRARTRALTASEDRFRVLTAATFEAVLIHDGQIVFDTNSAAEHLFSLERDDLIGAPISSLVEDPDMLTEEQVQARETRLHHPSGRNVDVEILSKSLPYQGQVAHVAAIRDITERKRYEEILRANEDRFRRLSMTDGLTGLFNRRHMNETLPQEIRRARRFRNSLVFMVIDVDFFKKFNDNYGHLQGDKALQSVAGVIRSKMRRAGDFVYRMGGEEFAVLTSALSEREALDLAETLRIKICELNIAHKGSDHGRLTVSIGVRQISEVIDIQSDQVIHDADHALYVAKSYGRDCVRLFDANEKPKNQLVEGTEAEIP